MLFGRQYIVQESQKVEKPHYSHMEKSQSTIFSIIFLKPGDCIDAYNARMMPRNKILTLYNPYICQPWGRDGYFFFLPSSLHCLHVYQHLLSKVSVIVAISTSSLIFLRIYFYTYTRSILGSLTGVCQVNAVIILRFAIH